MKINLNDEVKVKLTEKGKEICRQKGCCLVKCCKNNEISIKLWKLMSIFGEDMHHGQDAPFEGNNIEIVKDEIKTTTINVDKGISTTDFIKELKKVERLHSMFRVSMSGD